MAAPPAPPPPRPNRVPAADIDVPRLAGVLDRLDASLAEFDAAGAALAAAVRAADAAAMADAADRRRAAADGLRAAAADRAALLRAHGSPSLTRLAEDSRLVHLVSRCGSLAGRLAETRRRSRSLFLANRRAAAACGDLRDLLSRGGRKSVGYTAVGAEAGGGGALLNAAA